MLLSGSSLAKNTAALYVLSLSSQLINLFLIPFETRVLGPSVYGVISLAVAMSLIVTIVMDFGFVLSATEKVVQSRGETSQLRKLLANVTSAKLAISVLVGLCIVALLCFVEPFSSYKTLFLLYYAAYVMNALLPDYLYRGLEDMRPITVRTVAVRFCSMLPIFFLLRGPENVNIIPAMILAGNLAAVIFSLLHLKKKYDVYYVMPDIAGICELLRYSFPFFVSRFASTFYQSLNSVLLGWAYPGQPIVGCYGAAEKVLSLSKTFASPIADSLYPYMIRTKNYRLCGKIIIFIMPVILVCCLLLFVFAEQVSILVFGEGYAEAGVLIRCLLPAAAVILPTYIVCFPILVPLGLSNYANRSNVIGAILQVIMLLFLWTQGGFNAVSLCIAVSITEVAVFAYRLYASLRYGLLAGRR